MSALFLTRGPFSAKAAGPGHGVHNAGALELDVKSEFSHIRVRRQGNLRAMLFVRDKGEEKETEADLSTIRSAFRHAYTFRPPSGNLIVMASTAEARLTSAELHARAKQADHRFKATFSFQDLLSRLRDK